MKKKLISVLSALGAIAMAFGASSCTGAVGPQGEQGSAGKGIVSVVLASSDGNKDTYTITYSDGTTSTFVLTNGSNGEKGDNGKDGRSITNILKTNTEGNVDTYTIVYSDGSISTFTVTNGSDGSQGIQGEKGEDGHTPVITIGEDGCWCVDGVSTGITAKGKDGTNGKDGVSITKIEKTSSTGNIDIYTISYSDGTTSYFTVTNGEKGEQGIQGIPGEDGHSPTITINEDGYWCVDGKNTGVKAQGNNGEKGDKGDTGAKGTSVLNGSGKPSSSIGLDGDSYIDTATGDLYIKEKGSWEFSLNLKGDAGAKGASLLTGNGKPSEDIGSDGDSYIDLDTWLYYTKADGSWTCKGSIKGDTGGKGDNGRSVQSIEKTLTSGNVDTYTITYSDGNTATFTITNGKNGEKGIQGEKGADGHTPVITIGSDGYWYIDGISSGIAAQGEKGDKGDKGDAGVSVTSTKIDENGDLIITFSDGTTQNAGHVQGDNKCTVNFHIGNEIIKTEVVDRYSKISAPSEEYTAGYDVTSWYMNDSSGEAAWDFKGYFYRVYENLDLYAKYTANTYKVTFVDNDQGHSVDSINVTYAAEYTLPTLTSTEDETVFLGWYDKDGNAYQGGKWKTPSDITLYAEWSRNGFKLTFDANGGTVSPSTMIVANGNNYTLPTPTRDNYVFLGWYDFDNEKIDQTGTWSRELDETLTAKWEAESYTYVLDANGGTCSKDSITIAYKDSWNLPYPTRDDDDSYTYKFAGWYLNDTKISNSGTSWTYGTGGTLVAKWDSTALTKLGTYPQTHVTDASLMSTLDDLAGAVPTTSDAGSWSPYGYYDNDSMWYQDITYNDTKYRGVYYTSSRGNNTDNGYATRTAHWFKWEAIKWRTLSDTDGSSLILSDKILDSQQYYRTGSSSLSTRAPYDSTTTDSVYDNNYRYSDIRGFLNTTFYKSSFTTSEKSSIKVTDVDNSASNTGWNNNRYVCANTSDRVFLLSYSEVSSSSNGFSSDPDRVAYATDYAKCQGAYVYSSEGSSYNGASYWWTRSPYDIFAYIAVFVFYDGHVDLYSVSGVDIGVRPALKIAI